MKKVQTRYLSTPFNPQKGFCGLNGSHSTTTAVSSKLGNDKS
jgi:hypothetical protein